MNFLSEWARYCSTKADQGTRLQDAAWLVIYILTSLSVVIPIIFVGGKILYYLSFVPFLLPTILIAVILASIWIVHDQL